MYQILFKKSAIKGLRRMPRKIAGRIISELERIASSPLNYSGDWKKLSGSSYWRLRVGRYRAICDLHDDELVLLVIHIGPGGDVYK